MQHHGVNSPQLVAEKRFPDLEKSVIPLWNRDYLRPWRLKVRRYSTGESRRNCDLSASDTQAGWTPDKTFGGDNFGINSHQSFLMPRSRLRA
jgi:hypothetical protein